jgi:hypothetical protein
MSNLRIAELDFDQIKSNLKTFLNAQTEFTDYDFEGSGLSILLDVLAYNTHYNAYLANMVVNEMFLDSAVKRSSAVSIAKHLGYTPTSVRGSSANIDVVVTNPTGLPNTLTMDRYTQFTSTVDGTAYNFLTNQAASASRSGVSYTFADVDVIEGTLLSFRHVVSDTTPDAKYEIPSLNVDTTTLEITVQTSSSDTTLSVYTLATDITGIDDTSKVFFLEENTNGKYQVYFGDGVIGKSLTAGNIITIQYLISSGSAVNVSSTVSQSFTASSTIGGSSSVAITVNSNSTGGANAETITAIKFNAPKVNASRNRAVTSVDYESLILANYSGAEAVSVWGGEDNIPPFYGRVMISLKPFSGFTISDAVKENIKNDILKTKQVLAITPVFVDPEFFYVNITAGVRYYSALTTLTSGAIKTLVENTIAGYFSTELQKFNKTYNNSKLISLILAANSAINSVIITIKLQKRIVPVLNTGNTFTGDASIKFVNPITPGEVVSSYFFITVNGEQTLVKIADLPNETPSNNQGSGVLRLINPTTGAIVSSDIGTVNYATGELSIQSLTPAALPAGTTDIRLNAGVQESYYNLNVYKNQILVQDDTAVNAANGLVAGVIVTSTAIV